MLFFNTLPYTSCQWLNTLLGDKVASHVNDYSQKVPFISSSSSNPFKDPNSIVENLLDKYPQKLSIDCQKLKSLIDNNSKSQKSNKKSKEKPISVWQTDLLHHPKKIFFKLFDK